MENCSFFDACVRQIAKDVAGQDWTLQLRDETKKDSPEETKKIKFLLDDPNTDDDSLTDIFERCIVDWGVIGWWGIEVTRGTDGEVNGLYHLPARTFWIHKDGNKFCQLIGVKKVWFKRFGYDAYVHRDTGIEATKSHGKDEANELIYYRNYYAKSSWYGAPNIIAAIGPVKGLIGIRDYNLSFFENYGIPAGLVILKGKWSEEAAKQISDFIDTEIKGSENAHKTIVLNPPAMGEVEWKPLIVEIKEGHFKLYFKQLRDEVLVCYRMPPYRIGIAETGSLGGGTSAESTPIYVGSVVNPLKNIINFIMSEKIIAEGLSCESYWFKLGELDIRDLTRLIDQAEKLFGMGALTRNGVCDMTGQNRITKEAGGGDDYFISTQYAPLGEASVTKLMNEELREIGTLRREIKAALGKK
jgi:capsid portal protein